MNKHSGFTLLEVIIAVAIFAIMGVISSIALHQMIVSHTKVGENDRQWQQLETARRLVWQDFSHISSVITLDDKNKVIPLLAVDKEDVSFATTSIISNNIPKAGDNHYSVTYNLVGSKLKRKVEMKGFDGKIISSDDGVVLLNNIQDMTWSFLYQGKWTSSWSIINKLPDALKITATVKDKGRFEWVVPAMSAYNNNTNKTSGGT